MDTFDPQCIDRLLLQYHYPRIESIEDLLDQIRPQRRYLGPGYWLQQIKSRADSDAGT